MLAVSQLLAVFVVFCLMVFGPKLDGRVHNFSAGPGAVPVSVLRRARDEMLNYHNFGAAIFEMSHRDAGGPVQQMISRAEQDLRQVMNVPSSHAILYMQGGAHGQFAAIPLNLCSPNSGPAVYVVTGHWSQRALDEGRRFHTAVSINGTRDSNSALVHPSQWSIPANACYVHMCASETIDGLEYMTDPTLTTSSEEKKQEKEQSEFVEPPRPYLVADFTSTLLSRPVDFSRYAVVYASGGKNLGPAGLVAVIVHRGLLSSSTTSRQDIPSVLNWGAHYRTQPIGSIYNTPPVWSIYMHGLMMQHYQQIGGMPQLHKRALRRAATVYNLIDGAFYRNPVEEPYRSRMSIPFTIYRRGERSTDLEKLFVSTATSQGLIQLFGHPVRGGLRVTLYHGVPDEAVDALHAFMIKFRKQHE